MDKHDQLLAEYKKYFSHVVGAVVFNMVEREIENVMKVQGIDREQAIDLMIPVMADVVNKMEYLKK